jgi:hypothetical protein
MKEIKWGTKLIGVHVSIPEDPSFFISTALSIATDTVEGQIPSDSCHVRVSSLDRFIAFGVVGSKPFLVKGSRYPIGEVIEVPTN